MAKFMCIHTLGPNAITREQANQMAQAAQRDPDVRGYRSFLNLSEGKVVCVLEATNKELISAWFKKMGMPVDSISRVELEGEFGSMMQLEPQIAQTAAGMHA